MENNNNELSQLIAKLDWQLNMGAKAMVEEKLNPQLLVTSMVSGKLLVKAVPQSSKSVNVITKVLGPIF